MRKSKDENMEASLLKAYAFISSNFSEEELSKIPKEDIENYNKGLEKFNYQGLFSRYEDLDDDSKIMLVALIKKYILDKKQNAKLDELLNAIDEKIAKGGV